MNRKSLILIILGLVCLIAIGTVILRGKNSPSNSVPGPTSSFMPQNNQLSPTGEPISVGSDWETYANSKYGYSLKYPPGWSTIINITTESSKQETLPTATSLDIFNGAANKGYPDGVMTIQQISTDFTPPSSWKKSDITLNGTKAQKFEGEDKGFYSETYLIPQISGIIKIDVRYSAGDTIQQTFAAMLSTFAK